MKEPQANYALFLNELNIRIRKSACVCKLYSLIFLRWILKEKKILYYHINTRGWISKLGFSSLR